MAAGTLSGCMSVRHYASDVAWPFGNPNKPANVSETASRALGHEPAVTPLVEQPGNVWPGQATPPPTIGDVARSMDTPLGQGFTPSLASPGPDYVAPASPGAQIHGEPQAQGGGTDYSIPSGAQPKLVPPTQ